MLPIALGDQLRKLALLVIARKGKVGTHRLGDLQPAAVLALLPEHFVVASQADVDAVLLHEVAMLGPDHG
ncbi:hypothetical protein D9M68_899640 [compost metagenome]